MGNNDGRSTVITTPIEHINTEPSRLRYGRMVQNFLLVWLDPNIDEVNNDYQNAITQLRQVVNTIYTFVDVDKCVDFITDIKTEKIFVIVSGHFGEKIVPMIHDTSQLFAMYIFSANVARHEQWANRWPKIRGVFTDITSICEALKQATQECDQNSISISFIGEYGKTPYRDLDQLDPSFMYTQILKEVLLTIDFEQKHFDEFITYCREQFAGNTVELGNIDKYDREYPMHQPIWWYTYPCFLYSMLNRALRTMEVDLIVKMGFFIRDLHNHITVLHAEQYGGENDSKSFIVYRGQRMSPIEFDQLRTSQGGLISFNNFLSTSLNQTVSYTFSNRVDPSTVGVLFQISIDSSISSFVFANVSSVTYYREEEEILFSMNSVFRIEQIEQIESDDGLWQVNLKLTRDNDPALHALTDYIRNETFSSYSGWYQLGNLLLKMGEFNRVQQVYEMMLNQTADEIEKAHIYNQFGKIKYNQGEYNEAIMYDEKALQTYQKVLPANHPDLATSYNNIGGVYRNMGEYSKALSYYGKALEIYQKTLPSNHPVLSVSYNNIGVAYQNMGEYSKTLSYYEKALEIFEKTLPSNHPNLSMSYNNIGLVYDYMGEYSKALSYYEKALEIRQKTLPANHPDLATSYNNIGGVYHNMGEYQKTLSYLERALEIKQKSLPPNHPSLGFSYSNMGFLYYKMGEYSKALSYHEKAVDIYEKSLPSNHPNLAIAYNNIALIYDDMGEYSQALAFHNKALKIRQKTLPPNHPDFAISYTNIGLVYDKLDDCAQALQNHEQALEIYQKTLPENHPDLAAVYNNIGEVYFKMEKYANTLSYYKRALDILQRSLSSNHPNIKVLKENIEKIKSKTVI